jgi:hypothetical protein
MARLILERAEGGPARSGSEAEARAVREPLLAALRRPVRSARSPRASCAPGHPDEKRRY